MFLYGRNNGDIDVYKLEPKPEEIKEYKIRELNKNKPKFFIHYSEEYPKPFEDSFLMNRGDKPFEVDEIYRTKWYTESHNYLREDKNADMDSFINKYSTTRIYDFSTIQLVTKNNSNEILYRFLLTEPFYRDNSLKGIVDLPESLYLLRLLERENIDKLLNEEICEQLKLFKLYLYDKLRIDELRRGCDCLLIPGCYNGMLQKVENTEKLLKKII